MLVGLTVTDWEKAGKRNEVVKQASNTARKTPHRVIRPRVRCNRLFLAPAKAEDFAVRKTDER
jgi:hypothetical protein